MEKQFTTYLRLKLVNPFTGTARSSAFIVAMINIVSMMGRSDDIWFRDWRTMCCQSWAIVQLVAASCTILCVSETTDPSTVRRLACLPLLLTCRKPALYKVGIVTSV